jgi:hypothetical protein
LAPEATPLAKALRGNGLAFTAIDLTAGDCAMAAKGITETCRLGMQRRYLYLARAAD